MPPKAKVTCENISNSQWVIPGFAVNPTTTSPPAMFQFEIKHTVECESPYWVKKNATAILSFIGVPSYSCITSDDMKRYLPLAIFRLHTDGVGDYIYSGAQGIDSETSAKFVFRLGAPCITSITVSRTTIDQAREQRAGSLRLNCELSVVRNVCATPNRSDTWAKDEVMRRVAKECKTLNAYYEDDASLNPSTPSAPKFVPTNWLCKSPGLD